MNGDYIVFAAVVGRTISACVALAGAAYLANHGKDGWGWLIFAALLIGCFGAKSN